MKASFCSRRFASTVSIWLVSLASGLCILAICIFLQWLVYDDWMHRTGPLQIVGSLLASALSFFVVMRWQKAILHRKEEMLQHFESIKWMNDRIRNCLQTIELLTFAHSQATEQVRAAVDSIEAVLQEVLEESHPASADPLRNEAPERDFMESQETGDDRPSAASFRAGSNSKAENLITDN